MHEQNKATGLDDFTRNYLYVLLGVALVGFVWWLSSLDFRVAEINRLLKADAELAAYPYSFRVVSLHNGVAQMSSPRSAELSAIQSLRVMYPQLKHRSAISDEMVSAQKELARVQSYAGRLVKEQEGVNTVSWVLDKRWLENHGVNVE